MTSISKELADALTLKQEQWAGMRQMVLERSQKLDREQKIRKVIAVVLKIATVVAGIILASGLTDSVAINIGTVETTLAQLLGIAILLVVGVERAVANYDRLMAVTAARDTLERVALQADHQFDAKHHELVRIKNSRPEESAEGQIKLLESLRLKLADAREKVEESLRKSDATAINRLMLDEKE